MAAPELTATQIYARLRQLNKMCNKPHPDSFVARVAAASGVSSLDKYMYVPPEQLPDSIRTVTPLIQALEADYNDWLTNLPEPREPQTLADLFRQAADTMRLFMV